MEQLIQVWPFIFAAVPQPFCVSNSSALIGFSKRWIGVFVHTSKLHLLDDECFRYCYSTLKDSTGKTISTSQKIKKIQSSKDKGALHWTGKIWINHHEYFDGISEQAWCFYIGSYQPLQKWLKDRKGRILSEKDVLHYSKIIQSISKTITIIDKIDERSIISRDKKE